MMADPVKLDRFWCRRKIMAWMATYARSWQWPVVAAFLGASLPSGQHEMGNKMWSRQGRRSLRIIVWR